MPSQNLLLPPRQTAGASPPRRPGSVRRTTSIDVTWPDGFGGNLRLDGRARDVATPVAGGAPLLLAEDSFVATLKPDRTIVSIESEPPRPGLQCLIGERGGGRLRGKLDEFVPEERGNATPLYLILDDISGTSLIANWAWSAWKPDWLEVASEALGEDAMAKLMEERVGVCTGFAPGSSALDPDRPFNGGAPVPDLRNPADPEGWHQFTIRDKINMRRARRIDVWLDGVIQVEAAFQDSASTPDGVRSVVHEYSLTMTADPDTLEMLSVHAQPRILPFPECPGATANLVRLFGTPLPQLRDKVLAELRGTAGCTHLNDAMRALADVPALVERLREAVPVAA